MAKRRAAKTVRRKSAKKMVQSVRMRRGGPAKKKTKKTKKSGNDWNKHVMQVFAELRAKNPDAKLGDAMKAAKKTYKKGPKPISAVSSSKFETVPMPKKKAMKPISAVSSSKFETVPMPKKKGSMSKKKARSRSRRRRR